MKLAITGKGGVGKTTLAALLCRVFADEGRRVIAVDADPDANLAQALGMPPDVLAAIRPIAEMSELIEERTGATHGSMGGVFRLNPKVDDIPSLIGTVHDGVTLLVMGKSKAASSGCYCPENVLLRRLLKYLVTERDEAVIVDMEAGIEHLTRGTAEAVDAFLVVVEPGQRSVQTAQMVSKLARQLGIAAVRGVGNKVRNDADLRFIESALGGIGMIGFIPFDERLMDADVRGEAPHVCGGEVFERVKEIRKSLDAFTK